MNIKLNIDGIDYTVTAIVPPPPVSPTGLLLVPVGIVPIVVHLDALAWLGEHDPATNGTALGATTYPVTIGGRTARAFPSDYTNHGGMRYHCNYASDTTSHNFVYAGDLWFDDPTPLAQMELDNNQVTADGKTYIFGAQCDANSGAWDITRQDTACHWVTTAAKGSPKLWPAKTWLHFEIASHRDDAGNITYDAVHFNGLTRQIGITLPSARNIGWKKGDCLVNFQEGGAGASGSIYAYGSNMRIARW